MFNNLQFSFEKEYIDNKLEYLDLKIKKLEKQINKKNFKDTMVQAEDDLFDYVYNKYNDNEELQAAAPIYYAKLKRCETVEEIEEFMENFNK